MENWDYIKTWYHGSPFKLSSIRKGSTITQDINLARIFSHKPTIVSIYDDGRIKHNGVEHGYLYEIIGEINPDDVYPHPNSSMEKGMEWLVSKYIKLKLIEEVDLVEDEILSEDEIMGLREGI